MNKIIIEFCPEDRARLDAIIAGLEKAPRIGLDLASAPDFSTPAPAADHPIDASTAHLEPPADPEPAPAVKPVSLAEFQKAITVRCAESQKTKEAVRALVNQYASSVSDIPEDKRSEVLEKLAAI